MASRARPVRRSRSATTRQATDGPLVQGETDVSASALSQMGACERLVAFEHREGKRPTTVQKAALRRGVHAHRRFACERALEQRRLGQPCTTD